MKVTILISKEDCEYVVKNMDYNSKAFFESNKSKLGMIRTDTKSHFCSDIMIPRTVGCILKTSNIVKKILGLPFYFFADMS